MSDEASDEGAARRRLSELFLAHGGELVAKATVALGDGYQAEDLVQDLFVRIWRRERADLQWLHGLDPKDQARVLAYRQRSMIIDVYRRHRRAAKQVAEISLANSYVMAPAADEPHHALISRQLLDRCLKEIATMRPRRRDVMR